MILLLLLTAVVAAYVAGSFMTPIYQASTTVLIRDSNSMQNPFLQGLTGTGTSSQTQNYVEILKSRSLLVKALERLGQPADPESPQFASLQAGVSVQPVQGTDIIRIAVESSDPRQAMDLANSLVAAFGEMNQSFNSSEARSAVNWIADQLGQVEKNLRQAEEALRNYKERAHIYEPSAEVENTLKVLADLQTQQAAALVASQEAQMRLDELRNQLAKQSRTQITSTTVSSNPNIQALQGKLADLEAQLAGLRHTYGDNYPQTRAVQAQIDELHRQIQQQVAKIVSAETETVNPLYQGLLEQIVAVQSDVLGNQARATALSGLIQKTESSFKSLPQKELELARLERDQQVTEGIYVMLKQKYEEMQITEAMKTSDVQVVDPAILPTAPVRPRKVLNMAIAAFLALFVGVGLAFLMEMLDTTLKTREDVETVLGIPVLAAIPRSVPTERGPSGSRPGEA